MWAAKCPNVIWSGVGLKPNLSAGIDSKAATVAFSRPSSIPRRTSEKGDFACCPTADTDRRTIQPQNKLLIQSLHRFQRKDKPAFGARPLWRSGGYVLGPCVSEVSDDPAGSTTAKRLCHTL